MRREASPLPHKHCLLMENTGPYAERESPGRPNSKVEMRWGRNPLDQLKWRNQGTKKKSCEDGTQGEKEVGSGREEMGKLSSTL